MNELKNISNHKNSLFSLNIILTQSWSENSNKQIMLCARSTARTLAETRVARVYKCARRPLGAVKSRTDLS
jgi:hypothetical protein